MLSGVQIICFAASYGVALLLELSRLLFRSGVRGAVMLGFAAAGLLAHTIFLGHRAASATGAPLSSQQDWYLLAAWLIVAFYLYLVYYFPRVPFGMILLPLALGLIGTGAYFASDQPMPPQPALRVWGSLHAGSMVLATVAVAVGFMAGMMYLLQVWRLKRKLPAGRGPKLPSLEWLERMNVRALAVSVIMLAVGVGSGFMMKATQAPGSLPWFDPVVISTALMFAWLVAALIVTKVARGRGSGRQVAYLTVASFVFLAAALAAGLLLDTQHGSRGAEGPAASRHVGGGR